MEKELFLKIVKEIMKGGGFHISDAVLERAYKKHIKNHEPTGRNTTTNREAQNPE